jgi:hypothetical protein
MSVDVAGLAAAECEEQQRQWSRRLDVPRPVGHDADHDHPVHGPDTPESAAF